MIKAHYALTRLCHWQSMISISQPGSILECYLELIWNVIDPNISHIHQTPTFLILRSTMRSLITTLIAISGRMTTPW